VATITNCTALPANTCPSQRLLRRRQDHAGRPLVVGNQATFPDAGARGDPLVAGVDHLLQVVVRQDAIGDVHAPTGNLRAALHAVLPLTIAINR